MTSSHDRHAVPRIELPMPPAHAGLADALRAALPYWRATLPHWILPVLAVALVNVLAELILGGSVITSAQLQALVVTGPLGPQLDTAQVPKIVAGPLAVGIVSVVARWFLAANAIAGLRGREMTAAWVIGAGLRSFAADMIVALTVVTAMSLALMFGMAGILGLVLLMPFAVYAGLRLQLWTLAIFDGRSVFGGAGVSWRLTRLAVLRVLGWSLAIAGIGLVFTILLAVVDAVSSPAPVVGAVVGSVIEMSLTALTIVVLAVLYESQRQRVDEADAVRTRQAEQEAARGPFDPPPPPPTSWPG